MPRRTWARAAVVLLCAAACTGGGPELRQKERGSDHAVVIATADLRGYLEPCGCTQNMRGGIARAAAEIGRIRGEGLPVLFLDGGDSLFSSTVPPSAAVPQELRKAEAIAAALSSLGLATRCTGELDMVGGQKFLDHLGLPSLPPGTFGVFRAGAARVAVVSAATDAELVDASRQARGSADFVLAFFHQPIDLAQRAAALDGLEADLIVATHGGSELAGEESRLLRGRVPVVEVQSKGRSLLRLDLFAKGREGERYELLRSGFEVDRELYAIDQRLQILKRQAADLRLSDQARAMRQQKVTELIARRAQLADAPPKVPGGQNSFRIQFVPIEESLPEDPKVKQMVAAYDRDAAELNLAWAKRHRGACPEPEPGKAKFVGTEACKSCHPGAYRVWQGTKHALAYESLVKAVKQYDVSCVSCHVTGMDRPGGVCGVDLVEGRAHVGCESCHGPGSIHAEHPRADDVVGHPAEAVCAACHNHDNSPAFDFAGYAPRILGQGHGASR